MTSSHKIQTTALIALAALTLGCTPRDEPAKQSAGESASHSSATILDSAAVQSASLAFRQFLNASREGSATRDSLRALTSCGDGNSGSYFPTTLLASYSLLPFDMRGDTVIARASVVTVAEQDVDRRTSRFTARQRVREDVLEWDVIPTDEPERWVICNGLGFGYIGADSLTTWRPDGASYNTARALVDSIVKVRGN